MGEGTAGEMALLTSDDVADASVVEVAFCVTDSGVLEALEEAG